MCLRVRSYPKHLIIVLCLCLCWVLPAGRSITPEDIVNLQYVTDAVISSDGNHVAFVLIVPRTDDEEPGPSHSEVWVKRKDDTRPKRFTSKSLDSYSPGWSTDGRKITFLSKRDSKKNGAKIYTISFFCSFLCLLVIVLILYHLVQAISAYLYSLKVILKSQD